MKCIKKCKLINGKCAGCQRTIKEIKREGEKMKTKILSVEIEAAQLISNNRCADYFFIPASIKVQVGKYKATLQTALSYCHNDMSTPSNNLEVYDGDSDLILFKLDQAYESIIDNDDFIDELNEACATNYFSQELASIRDDLINVINQAQIFIREEQEEAEEDLKCDDKIYVLYTEREQDVDGNIRICSEPQLKIFANENTAQQYVDGIDQTIDLARIITKEIARSRFL